MCQGLGFEKAQGFGGLWRPVTGGIGAFGKFCPALTML
jgi:hypothetical protein